MCGEIHWNLKLKGNVRDSITNQYNLCILSGFLLDKSEVIIKLYLFKMFLHMCVLLGQQKLTYVVNYYLTDSTQTRIIKQMICKLTHFIMPFNKVR